MMDSKYSKFLTILLIIIVIAIVGLLGFLGFNLIRKVVTDNQAEKFTEQYEDEVSKNKDDEDYSDAENPLDNIESTNLNGQKKYKYKGFDVAGTIEIPKTKVKYPVLYKVSKKGLETSVCIQYGARFESAWKYCDCWT